MHHVCDKKIFGSSQALLHFLQFIMNLDLYYHNLNNLSQVHSQGCAKVSMNL